MLFGDFFFNKLVQIDEMYSKMNIKYIFDYDKQGMLINLWAEKESCDFRFPWR